MEHEIFEIEQQRSSLVARNADLMEGDRNTTAVLRDVDKQHRSEIEGLNKEHRLALKKQVCVLLSRQCIIGKVCVHYVI